MPVGRKGTGANPSSRRTPATWWQATGDGLRISVAVTTGARRSQVIGRFGSALRVKLAARPVDGRANDELIRLLADLFAVRRSAVTIVHGRRGRSKVVAIAGPERPPPNLLN